jgi:hypothetical protein
MLTTQQQLSLKAAAKFPEKDRIKEINSVIATLKLTNSLAFHFHEKDGTPSESMKARKFFDEPYSINQNDFWSYEVEFQRGKQKEMFEARDKKLLKK